MNYVKNNTTVSFRFSFSETKINKEKPLPKGIFFFLFSCFFLFFIFFFFFCCHIQSLRSSSFRIAVRILSQWHQHWPDFCYIENSRIPHLSATRWHAVCYLWYLILCNPLFHNTWLVASVLLLLHLFNCYVRFRFCFFFFF